ncbi:MAG: SRPBCC family protein, partial [Acidobacteriota bacterium]
MKVLKTTLVIMLILVILAVIVGVLLPSSAHVERSTTIDAPPATVFALVNGFALFNRWSPWFEMDPEARYSYEGPAFGPGAKISWVSDNP